ncbi:MAG TPA: outer membrane lipoprotein carrier protein LolA [bacterium]|nr:outer membrane lipoprotein carrier protein LolA [bacterium]
MKKCFFICLTLLLAATAMPLRAQNAEAILAKVKQKYQSLKQVCAEFEQTFHWKMAGETQVTRGSLCTQNGVQFRIELQDQTIVTDGVTLWTLSQANRQVMIDHAANGKENNPFLSTFIEKYFKSYRAVLAGEETVQGTPHYHLLLTALSEDEFERTLDLWVNKSTLIMSRIKLVDVNGNDSIYEVTSLNLKPALNDQDFVLTVPEGFETVDLR